MSGVCLSLINCWIFRENATRFSKKVFQPKQGKTPLLSNCGKYSRLTNRNFHFWFFLYSLEERPSTYPLGTFLPKWWTQGKIFLKKDPALRQEQGRTYEREIWGSLAVSLFSKQRPATDKVLRGAASQGLWAPKTPRRHSAQKESLPDDGRQNV